MQYIEQKKDEILQEIVGLIKSNKDSRVKLFNAIHLAKEILSEEAGSKLITPIIIIRYSVFDI